jgi:hypothetical protein
VLVPITKWACPPERPTFGNINTPEHCILECPHRCAAPHLISALTLANRNDHHKGKYLSVTSLSGCERRLQLERNVDYADYMKNSLYSYRGTVMHSVLEDAAALELPNGVSLASLGYLT